MLKKKKKRKRRKVKRKREIRSYKKENKWENLLPLSLPPLSSPPSTLSIIIHLTWEYNHHKWYLLCFYNPLSFISIFAFSQVIPLEVVSLFPSASSHDASKDRNPFELHSFKEESELRGILSTK